MIDLNIYLDRTPIKDARATQGDYGSSFLTLTLSNSSELIFWATPDQFPALQQIAAAFNTMRVVKSERERIQEPAE